MNLMNDNVNAPPDTLTQAPGEGEALAGEAVAGEAVSNKAGLGSLLYEILETIVLAAVIWLVVNFATARFIVEGSSMEPNFHTGQMLIVSRLAYQLGSPHRGDVIVFQYPGNPVDDYIKRVIGLPGDTVDIRAGRVLINGAQIPETYLGPQQRDVYRGEWVVPANSYFVMGDNRLHSSDSRSWGMLARGLIIGKAWLSYWPPKYWGVVPQVSYSAGTP
jgi:signal peptidase I